MAHDVKQILKSNTKTSAVRYDLAHHSDGQQSSDNTAPTTPADMKIHKAHKVDSIYYNMNHAHDHLEEMVHSFNDIKREDPTEAKRLLKLIKKTLGHCLKNIEGVSISG